MPEGFGDRQRDLAIGYASLGLFLGSLAILVWFLLSGVDRGAEDFGDALGRSILGAAGARGDGRATFNILLIAGWVLLRSLTARPRFKAAILRRVPAHLEPAVHALVASASLVLVCLLFRPIPRVVYALEGGAVLLARLLFWGGWALFAWCWLHRDLLEMVGLRPILRHHGGAAAPAAVFRPSGPFLWVRHPVELALLVAFWSAPLLTVGHLLFAALMTVDVLVGIDLEDRRLLAEGGPGYLEYARRVPQILPLFR